MGVEPTSSAWKAEVLPLNYTRQAQSQRFLPTLPAHTQIQNNMVEGGGFEPPKAEPSDLQSDPFGHSGTPPRERSCVFSLSAMPMSTIFTPEFLTFRAPAVPKPGGNTVKKTPERLTPGLLIGAGTKSRTRDLLITSQLLYQLSYTGNETFACQNRRAFYRNWYPRRNVRNWQNAKHLWPWPGTDIKSTTYVATSPAHSVWHQSCFG